MTTLHIQLGQVPSQPRQLSGQMNNSVLRCVPRCVLRYVLQCDQPLGEWKPTQNQLLLSTNCLPHCAPECTDPGQDQLHAQPNQAVAATTLRVLDRGHAWGVPPLTAAELLFRQFCATWMIVTTCEKLNNHSNRTNSRHNNQQRLGNTFLYAQLSRYHPL